MKKSNVRAKSSSQPLKSYRTDQTLTRGVCQNTFYNLLRSDNPQIGHAETKMTFVPIKVNQKKKVPTSHIFSGENPSEIKVSKKKGVRYTPSNIIFNDDYFEKNPKINPLKKKGHMINKLWQENKHMNGQMINSKSCKTLFKRRIDENYNTNPLKINTKEENQKMNQEIATKQLRHAKAYKGFLGSQNCKRILGGINNPILENKKKGENDLYNNKITKNNFNINQKAVMINKNKDNFVPYYGKRQFRAVSFGKGSYTFA
jgi:hypothetical protein